MAEYLQYLLNFVAAHTYWAYALVFLMTMAEDAPIVGTVVPGSPVILAVSALVPSGAIGLWPLMFAVAAGAVCGDAMAYSFGRRYHRGLLERWPFRRYPQLFSRGQAFFQDHGQKSIFLSRFVRGPHAVVPLIAGIMHMPLRPFFLMNVASVIVWVPLHVLAGVLVGASLTLAGAVAGRLAVFVVVLIGTLWLIGWLVRYLVRRGMPWLIEAQNRLWNWARAHPGWLGRVILSLLDPAEHELRGLVFTFMLMMLATLLFVWVLASVISGEPLVRADVAVFHFLQGLRTTWGDQIMIRLTELGDGWVITAITVLVSLWLLWRRAWRTALYWVTAVGVAAIFSTAMKLTLRIPRPEAVYTGWSAFSFPSTHAVVNAVAYGFFALIVGREISPRWRGPLVGVIAVWIAAMAFSRLYLGVHWLSDVIGGLAFAFAWVALLGIAYIRHSPAAVSPRALTAVLVLGLLLVGGYHVLHRFPSDTERYAVNQKTRVIKETAWWNGQWRSLPPRRMDLTGGFADPIRLQWAGLLVDLKHQLDAHGWREPRPWSLSTSVTWFTPKPHPEQLPVLPHLHDGRPPDMIMVHAAQDNADQQPRRIVLLLWRSHVEVRSKIGNTAPVWLATLSEQVLLRPLSFMTITHEQKRTSTALELLAASLANSRMAERENKGDNDDQWGGLVVLARGGQPGASQTAGKDQTLP